MPPKVLLHGSGAIGTIYVYLLLKAGCDVTAVCRSNYDAASANGFTIDSDMYGKGIYIKPNVVQSPAEATSDGPFDFVIVTTKVLPGPKPSTPEIIKPAVSDKTAIVLIQNGIGIEDEYAEAFPGNPLISCVVWLPTTQIFPGHIAMGNTHVLHLGTCPAISPDSPAYQAAKVFCDTLSSAGLTPTLFDDIQERRWTKLMINASWNPICALTLSRDVAYLSSSSMAEPMVKGVMLEVSAIARAKGYTSFSAESVDKQLQIARDRIGTKGIEPSMLVDVLNGRRMEVEVILGTPVKIAKQLGVQVPRLETLYALAKALDEAMALRQPGKSLAGDEAAAGSG